MRAVPVGVACMVPHGTVRGNGGVDSSFAGSHGRVKSDGGGGAAVVVCQKQDAAAEFRGTSGNSATAFVR